MKNQARRRHNPQSGNVFFWIFVMIALFGALSFAMTQSGRVGRGMLTTETTQMEVAEIAQYAQAARDSYKKMRMNGCAIANISFGNPVAVDAVFWPTPAGAPSDKSCHMYEMNGGGLPFTNFVHLYNDMPSGHPVSFIYALADINGLGTTAQDSLIVIANIKKDTCEQLNLKFNGVKTVYSATGIASALNTNDDLSYAECPNCAGKRAACIVQTVPRYNFYYAMEVH